MRTVSGRASRLALIGLVAALTCLGQQTADFRESVKAAMSASIEKQRLSIQKQAAAAASAPRSEFFLVAWPTPPAFDCDPVPKPDLDQMVREASEQQGLQPELVQAVIGKESAARPCALSAKGAQGLMQLMPSTAMELGVTDPFDPKQNIDGGARLLKQLLSKYKGDVALALGAYNAGSGRVDREGGIPQIPETIGYVADILNRFRIQ